VNEFLPSRYDERLDRLALGIEPVDALRGLRIGSPITVTVDREPQNARRDPDDIYGLSEASQGLGKVRRRPSCRFVVLIRDELDSPIALRFNDPTRRYVPRRIRYAVLANIRDRRFRVRRPALFPAAAYDVDETATGLRGRITWTESGEVPVRWARVEATIGGTRVGYAHGDDRGEFLLLLGSRAGGLGDLPVPLRAQVTVFAPPVMPPRGRDVFSDLPIETHPASAAPDTVSAGTALPSIVLNGVPEHYVASAVSTREVTFELGRLLTDQPKFFMAV
jgi:hypothetical protein